MTPRASHCRLTILSQIVCTLSHHHADADDRSTTDRIDPPPNTVDATSLSPPPEPSLTPPHRRQISWRGLDVDPCRPAYDLKVWVKVLRFKGFGSVGEREQFPEDFDKYLRTELNQSRLEDTFDETHIAGWVFQCRGDDRPPHAPQDEDSTSVAVFDQKGPAGRSNVRAQRLGLQLLAILNSAQIWHSLNSKLTAEQYSPYPVREKMDSLHSNIRDWKARGGGLFYCRTKLDIELEGDRGDCNDARGTSCADQPIARYILHSEGTSYANVSLGSDYLAPEHAIKGWLTCKSRHVQPSLSLCGNSQQEMHTNALLPIQEQKW